jgi:hypothetical protein
MNKRIRLVQVVQIGNSRYGPGRARNAACEWALQISFKYDYDQHRSKLRDFNAWHQVAFRRSLPIFEKLLGTSRNRTNPRTLFGIDLGTNTITQIPN